WEIDQISLQRKHDHIIQEISDIEAKTSQSVGEEKKYISIQEVLSAILVGDADWNRPGVNAILIDSFQYIAAENNQQFISRINDFLQIIRQVGLTPPAEEHLLQSVARLKEMIPTYSRAWAKSRQIINQTKEAIAGLSKVDQQQKKLEDSIQGKKAQLS